LQDINLFEVTYWPIKQPTAGPKTISSFTVERYEKKQKKQKKKQISPVWHIFFSLSDLKCNHYKCQLYVLITLSPQAAKA